MPKSQAKTLADFRATHDPNVVVPNKIRVALAAMLKDGPEHWEYEGDFVRRAGINQMQLVKFRDMFIDHIVETPAIKNHSARRVWFADKKVAAKLREC